MAEEEPVFPDTIEGFGYKFNSEGQLRNIETDEAYEFVVKEGDHHFNQKRYNALGDVITEFIYAKMEKEYKLKRRYLPVDAEENEPQSFVFVSEDVESNTEKLMILIHGSGAVRAGQWARRLIINDCLDSGTQLPYIKWAQENGYAVIVANTNINTVDPVQKGKKPEKIRGNSSPEEHTESLWREIVQQSKAQHIAIVAHSYGGVCTLELAIHHTPEFNERVFAIALTDSVHSLRQQEAAPEVVDFYKERVVNWASAYDSLDTQLVTTHDEVLTLSAGTDRHDYTSYKCMLSIFKFLEERYDQRNDPSKKRSCMDEPYSPERSEQQHLITRGRGEGQESAAENQSRKLTYQETGTDSSANQGAAAGQSANQRTDKDSSTNQNTVNERRPEPQGRAGSEDTSPGNGASGGASSTAQSQDSKTEL